MIKWMYEQTTPNREIEIVKPPLEDQPYLLIKVDAFDHKNRIESAKIKMWQIRVSKWYSSNSNRIHAAVAPPSTPADIFLSLHKKTSAAVV